MKRVLGLYIPFLSTDRLLRQDREAAGGTSDPPTTATERIPTATILSHGQTIRIVHRNRAACDVGIRLSQTLAEAKAIVPDLVTHEDDPLADRRQLEALAVWANDLSPIVQIEGDDTLLIDVTGCERLFGGESNLLRRAIEGLNARGFHARGGIADTPGAAWAITHAHPEPTLVAEPGQAAAHLAPLPVWSLRIDAKVTAALSSVGVETIEALLHLPRSSLGSRFGDDLLRRLDQAFGDVPEVLTPYRPKPAVTSRFEFGTATTRMDLFQEAIRRALERFCEKLSRRAVGVRQMFVTFYCPPVESRCHSRTVTLEANLSQPTRSAAHLHSLLRVLLDKLHLSAPADSLMLWAKHLDPLDDWQDELFVTDSRDAQALRDLLDRLATRLGSRAVVKADPRSDHQPERSFRYVSVVGRGGTAGNPRRDREGAYTPERDREGAYIPNRDRQGADPSERERPLPYGRGSVLLTAPSTSSRPLRLSSRPVEVAATALIPEGPPISFRLHGSQHTVVGSVGPERIETGWWRGPHVQRDYYRVTTESGLRYWLFRNRESGKWFLHGWFD